MKSPDLFSGFQDSAMTLLELNTLVRRIIEGTMVDEYWVQGELLDARVASNGHFYAELIQKDETGRNILARARVNSWARQFNMLHLRFQRDTGETLRSGLQVKILVRVTFHEQYGYALNMIDVDPTFTMGDMARKRREILAQLEADGIIDDNKTLPLPRLANRIAVISSETAAGYGDFCDQLHANEYGLRFTTRLFPATMQGPTVPESVMQAMEKVLESWEDFDVVVIIRGGGATSDLSDFDNYELACCIAQCPLPVIVGIGHDRDQTVLDFVAHTRVKTPTAGATFLVDHQKEEAALLEELNERIVDGVVQRIESEHQRLERLASVLPLAFLRVRERMEHRLELMTERMRNAILQRLERERSKLDIMQQRFDSLNPERLLRFGYSITTCNGLLVRDASKLKPGDEITTQLENGTINSIVK